MAYNVPSADQFEGQANIAKGARRGNSEILAEYLRKKRAGVVAVGAPGDIVVTFSEAFDDDSYTVDGLVFEDTTGGVDATMRVKTGTKAATGFTVVVTGVGAVGNLHYSALHD